MREIEISEYDQYGKLQQSIYPVAYSSNDPECFIIGVLCEMNNVELKWAGDYEGIHYLRKKFQLGSGIIAWVYVAVQNHS